MTEKTQPTERRKGWDEAFFECESCGHDGLSSNEMGTCPECAERLCTSCQEAHEPMCWPVAETVPEIPMQPVTSTLLAAIGYDAETQTLALTFSKGGEYHYAGISPETYAALMAAESHGKYFLAEIRGRYPEAKQ